MLDFEQVYSRALSKAYFSLIVSCPPHISIFGMNMRLKSFFIMSFRSLENFLNMAFFVLSHQQPFMAAGHIDYISCKSFDDTAVRILADNRFFSVIWFLGPSCEVQPVPVSEVESFGITDGETAFVGPDHLKVVLRSLPGDHQGEPCRRRL